MREEEEDVTNDIKYICTYTRKTHTNKRGQGRNEICSANLELVRGVGLSKVVVL